MHCLAIVSVMPLTWVAADAPKNPGFEDGVVGRPPPAWNVRETSIAQGFSIEVEAQGANGSARCLKIARPDSRTFGQYGAASQSISAQPFRGRRIRFSAMIRTSGLHGYSGAGLFARVVRPDFRPGHVSEMNGHLERGKSWTKRSVVVDVAEDAIRVEVGLTLIMAGTAWFDDATIEVVGTAAAGNEPPRPFQTRGRENLEAFAKLLAYLRFFHPSDESADADWDRFAVGNISYIEQADSPRALAARLQEIFTPFAPTLQVSDNPQWGQKHQALESPPAGDSVRVIAWRHVGADPNAMYGRQRRTRVVDRSLPNSMEFSVSPEPLRKPSETYEADLGGGVYCRFPTSLFIDATGTLPRAAAQPRHLDKSPEFPPTGDDRATRLACVCLAWGLFQHFYPYFEETKADWNASLAEALNTAAVDRDATDFNRTMQRLVARLEDSHGAVRPGSGAPRNDGALPFSWDLVEGKLAVTWVDPSAGLRVKTGDVVTHINAEPVARLLADSERFASGATVTHRRYRVCADLRMGPSAQPVTLEFQTPTREAYSLTVKRRAADDSPLRGPTMREPRLPRLHRLAEAVLYVDLDRFNDRDLYAALPELHSAKGIVFDIRGYPQVSLGFLRMFADRPWVQDKYGEVVTLAPDRRIVKLEMQKPPTLPPLEPRMQAKVAFVTDGRAVSYAETFLAIADNTKIGTIVGENTAGSNGGVFFYTLPDGTRVSWTGQKAIRADGSRLHGVGVRPAVPVSRTLAGLAAGRDEALDQAVAIVKPKG